MITENCSGDCVPFEIFTSTFISQSDFVDCRLYFIKIETTTMKKNKQQFSFLKIRHRTGHLESAYGCHRNVCVITYEKCAQTVDEKRERDAKEREKEEKSQQ